MRRNSLLLCAAAASALGFSAAANAAIFPEAEDNNTKAIANAVPGMVAGDTIIGTSTGTSTTVAGVGSADYFRVATAAAAPGIYRHRLVLTSQTVGHTGTIRGLTQTFTEPGPGVINAGTDAAFQTSSTTTTPARFNQWYGFGKAEEIYYRVTGTTATTAEYTATYDTQAVTPVDGGTYQVGSIKISSVGATGASQTDTDMWVYDSNFNAIATYGNDDQNSTTSLGSELIRNYAPGTYYLAISNFSFANDQPAPNDDDFGGSVMDFPNVAAASSTTANLNISVNITDSSGTPILVPLTKVGPYDVVFMQFTVAVPEPTSLAAVGLVGMGLFARRRRA